MSVKLDVIGGGVMVMEIRSRPIARGIYESTDVLISEPSQK